MDDKIFKSNLADEKLFEELEKYSFKKDSAALPESPKIDVSAPFTPPWERTHEVGVSAMEELFGDKYGMIVAPEAPEITITPRGEKIIPVCVSRRVSAHDMGSMRRFMEPDQINERMVSELLHPLLKELDEMGLIDLRIIQVNPETLEYSIRLDVVKHE